MTYSLPTRDEDHTSRTMLTRINTIMPSTRRHQLPPAADILPLDMASTQLVLTAGVDTAESGAGGFHAGDAIGVEVGGGGGEVCTPFYCAVAGAGGDAEVVFACGDGGECFAAFGFDLLNGFVKRGADVEAELDEAGDGVCAAGFEVQNARTGECVVFIGDLVAGDDHLRGCKERVCTMSKARGTGVAVEAVDCQSEPFVRLDAFDHTNAAVLGFENGPLFDVKFEVGSHGSALV